MQTLQSKLSSLNVERRKTSRTFLLGRRDSSASEYMSFADTLSHVQHHLQRDTSLGTHGCIFAWRLAALCDVFNLAELRPSALLCASTTDIEEDTFHLATRRLHLKGQSAADLRALAPVEVLSFNEKKRLADYVTLWQRRPDPKCSFDDLAVHLSDQPNLQQNGKPRGWVCWSAASCSVPTIRKSSGIIYSPNARRQFLLKELFAGMGYPTFQDFAERASVPRFEVFQPILGLTYRHMLESLGDSQHVASVGVFGAVALATSVQNEQAKGLRGFP